MRLLSGTSGFSYPPWRGSFYPPDLPERKMLDYYATRLPAVEINNTFYRMPRADMLARWAEQVPAGFRFALKASRRITHQAKLVDCADAVAFLWTAASALGEHLGPVLFQTPPTLKADAERLAAFLDCLPAGCRAAFEFRHPSWSDDAIFAQLRDRGCAWAICDSDDGDDPPLIRTATWGYLRLRREDYSDTDLARWAERLRGAGWDEAYVFFKHEEEGAAPAMALRLAALFS